MSAWYKHYAEDFLTGTMSLTLEQKGAYIVCLNLMYKAGGPIHDDARLISRFCGCSLQRWTKIRQELIDLCKLQFHASESGPGKLSNSRASYQMHRDGVDHRKASEAGKRSGEVRKVAPDQEDRREREVEIHAESREKPINKSADNPPRKSRVSRKESRPFNTLGLPEPEHTQTLRLSEKEEKEGKPSSSSSTPTPPLLSKDQREIVNAWTDMAERTNLSVPRVITDKRRKRLAERLREHGVDGMLEAIGKIGDSAFCHGSNDRGWRADFDFLIQEGSCARARDGGYDNRAPKRMNGEATVAQHPSWYGP